MGMSKSMSMERGRYVSGLNTYAGAGLLSGRQRHGGGEEEGEREETHFGFLRIF
jgi:hypothetical protein